MNSYHTIRYDNLLLRIGGSLFGAVFITLFGTETSLFKAMRYPAFYMVAGFSFAVALLLTTIVHYVTVRLDRRFDWQEQPFKRVSLQVLLGVGLPVVTAYGIMLLYFRYIDGRDIDDSQYMLIDFPHIVYFLLLLNAYYVIHYLTVHLLMLRHLLHNESQARIRDKALYIRHTPDEAAPPIADLSIPAPEQADTGQAAETFPNCQATKNMLLVNSGSSIFELEVEREVCYFYRSGRTNWLITFSGDIYMVPQSLKNLEEKYCNSHFFRINRSIIINHGALNGYREGLHRKLHLELKPEYKTLAKGDAFQTVNRSFYSDFKLWFHSIPNNILS